MNEDKSKLPVDLFKGWSKEAQRRLTRDLNNITPCDVYFKMFMKELSNATN